MLALGLGGCGLYPRTDAVQAPGGLDQVEQRFAVRPLDPGSTVPLVKQALEQLEKTDLLRYYRGTTYGLTEGNRLPPGWLLQTPNAWGMASASVPFYPVDCKGCDADFRLPRCVADPDCADGACVPLAASVRRRGAARRKFCVGQSDRVVDAFYGLVASAQRAVDITMLAPAADFRFLAALRNAVTFLAYSRRPVTIRVIVGDYPPDGFDAAKLLRALVRDAVRAPKARLSVYVGAMRSCDAGATCGALSWNHSKIVAVDGKRAIVGGHNLWTPDYLAAAPVHDISMSLEGPAAADAHHFADALWGFLCREPRSDGVDAFYSYIAGAPAMARIGAECLSTIELPAPARPEPGGVPVLAVGRLASGITPVFADQSLLARDLMLGAATRTVRMLQQDVAFAAVEGVDPGLARQRAREARGADRPRSRATSSSCCRITAPPGRSATTATRCRSRPSRRRSAMSCAAAARWPSRSSRRFSAGICISRHCASGRMPPGRRTCRSARTRNSGWSTSARSISAPRTSTRPSCRSSATSSRTAPPQREVLRDYWDQAWKWSARAAISGEGAPRCIFAGTDGKTQ